MNAPDRRPGELQCGQRYHGDVAGERGPADDYQAVGLREAHQHHLLDITIAALRCARARDPTFPPRPTSAASNSSAVSAT
ncbi:hypothetical protein [Streptomyces sp. NBC_01294]|uniref:hypothetical protein n=1 Tax=Streptomyces sp. NBC_01294 TaxID=2903815 RepID=UPI002DD7FAC8|nr:hypothetical protein [Streptomyces sp. NBC_01294]WRZ55255.1 hypothetical protein OG534_01410 [Streptomyces sp. NBC_01294]WRZ61441.1 hypothetical protein OG534_36090 [Streptomyces sp. NBC_01294]